MGEKFYVQELLCEGVRNPLGIDNPNPKFSWICYHQGRGQFQSAYRIIVGSTFEDVCSGVGDMWDSGKVGADSSLHIPYGGKPLKSRTLYYWRVEVWDRDDVACWSEVSTFETAFLDTKEWKGRWIGRPKGGSRSPLFRKSFKVPHDTKRGRLYVAGLGYIKIYVNGVELDKRSLIPGWTDYEKLILYSTYDVSALLRKGENVVGVMLGNGRFSPPESTMKKQPNLKKYGDFPIFLLNLYLELEDGSHLELFTDSSWKSAESPIVFNDIYDGEVYDARLEQRGWNLPAFDDSKWESAVEVSAPCGELKSGFFLPPVKVCKTISPRKMFSPQSGVYLYDFGQNFSGWARLRVRGPRGAQIKLRYGELLNDDGTLNVAPNRTAEATDVYILKGEGEETYEPHFTYHGFRYVELTGYPGVPSLGSLEGCFVHSDVGEAGNFFCSNQLVNKIHENVRWGQLSNLMSIPTDCPQRDERMGWLGDAHLTAEEAMYNFYMLGFYKKWLLDLRKAQKEDGSLPDVVPPYWSIYPADPAWGAACIILPWELYLFYGDRDILVENYSMMKRWVEYLLSQLNDDGILPIGKYGDWCPPGHVMSVDTPVEFVSTWYLYYSLHLLSLIAHEVRNYDDKEKFAKKASLVRQAINKKFLGEKDFYGEVDEWFTVFIPAGEISEEERIKRKQNLHRSFARRSQTAQVLALFSGIVPDEKKEKVLKELIEDITVPCGYHLNTGIIGTKYVLDVLSDFGHVDLAFKLLTQTSYPSWGYMIKEGATTLWERWEYLTEGGMNSQNHIMLGTVGAYLYKYLAGIRPNPRSPGWKEFVIKPYPVDGLQFVRASLHTLRGLIRVEWEKAPKGLFIRVSIPMGTQAKVFFPTLGLDKVMVKEGGAPIWICEEPLKNQCGISFSHREKDRIVFNVESGDYTFEVSRLE